VLVWLKDRLYGGDTGDVELAWRGTTLMCWKGVTRGQTVRFVVNYIEARPTRMDEPFWQLALQALIDAWPSGRTASSATRLEVDSHPPE
jgi:Rap1a immunity proteins